MKREAHLNKKALIKFIAFSTIGLLAFVIPITVDGKVNTVLGLASDALKNLLSGVFSPLVLGLVSISTLGSLIEAILRSTATNMPGWFQKLFRTSLVYLVTKLVALVVTVCVIFGVGPAFLIASSTGGTMVDLAKTLVSIALVLSYVLPFLTDSGLMEFFGVITRPVVRPLFTVPSDASLDLITSWMGASSAAVILSAEKYRRGYYTEREAACVMCNFSLVSIPFCMVIASTAGVAAYFPTMYLLLIALGVFLAVVTPRIYPLKQLKDDYYLGKKNPFSSDKKAEGCSTLYYAVQQGTVTAEKFGVSSVLESGNEVLKTVCFSLLPMVIAWGTLGLVLVEFTPIFEWIAMPIQWIFQAFGIEHAGVAASASLVGFIDMFIPSLLVAGLESIQTRFIIATLSLIQIIYITEVGAVIIQTGIGVDFKKLAIIFLERTVLSLPIIVFVAKWLFP